MTVKTKTWPLGGGLDLVSPELSKSPGAALLAQNYEPELSGGYRRMDGYLAYDGSTTPVEVPGSGPVRGVWTYGGTVYAFRDNTDASACVMHKTTATGWVAVTTPTPLAAGGKYQFVNFAFTGSSASKKMYGCDGVNPAFEFDGTGFVQIATGMAVDTPRHIAAHKNHLFLAFEGGSVQHSAVGDPINWTLAGGAAELGVGAEITGMESVQGNVLSIFSDDRVNALYGTSAADWDLRLISNKGGAGDGTVVPMDNDIYFLNDAGVTNLQAVQTFGDFETSNLSRMVKPYLDSRLGSAVAAISIPEKSQYRIMFDDKTVLVGAFVNRQIVGFTTFSLLHTPSCAVSSDDGVYFGTADGFVMQMDTGTSFNGQPIHSLLRLPFTHLGTPHRKKRYRKVVIDVNAAEQASIHYSMDLEYGEHGSGEIQLIEQDQNVQGGGGFWDVDNWGGFIWSAQVVSRIEGHLDGSGRNMSLLIRHDSSTDKSFTLQGVQLNYSLRGITR